MIGQRRFPRRQPLLTAPQPRTHVRPHALWPLVVRVVRRDSWNRGVVLRVAPPPFQEPRVRPLPSVVFSRSFRHPGVQTLTRHPRFMVTPTPVARFPFVVRRDAKHRGVQVRTPLLRTSAGNAARLARVPSPRVVRSHFWQRARVHLLRPSLVRVDLFPRVPPPVVVRGGPNLRLHAGRVLRVVPPLKPPLPRPVPLRVKVVVPAPPAPPVLRRATTLLAPHDLAPRVPTRPLQISVVRVPLRWVAATVRVVRHLRKPYLSVTPPLLMASREVRVRWRAATVVRLLPPMQTPPVVHVRPLPTRVVRAGNRWVAGVVVRTSLLLAPFRTRPRPSTVVRPSLPTLRPVATLIHPAAELTPVVHVVPRQPLVVRVAPRWVPATVRVVRHLRRPYLSVVPPLLTAQRESARLRGRGLVLRIVPPMAAPVVVHVVPRVALVVSPVRRPNAGRVVQTSLLLTPFRTRPRPATVVRLSMPAPLLAWRSTALNVPRDLEPLVKTRPLQNRVVRSAPAVWRPAVTLVRFAKATPLAPAVLRPLVVRVPLVSRQRVPVVLRPPLKAPDVVHVRPRGATVVRPALAVAWRAVVGMDMPPAGHELVLPTVTRPLPVRVVVSRPILWRPVATQPRLPRVPPFIPVIERTRVIRGTPLPRPGIALAVRPPLKAPAVVHVRPVPPAVVQAARRGHQGCVVRTVRLFDPVHVRPKPPIVVRVAPRARRGFYFRSAGDWMLTPWKATLRNVVVRMVSAPHRGRVVRTRPK